MVEAEKKKEGSGGAGRGPQGVGRFARAPGAVSGGVVGPAGAQGSWGRGGGAGWGRGTWVGEADSLQIMGGVAGGRKRQNYCY